MSERAIYLCHEFIPGGVHADTSYHKESTAATYKSAAVDNDSSVGTPQSLWGRHGTIVESKTVPTEAATSRRDLTKSTHEPAKIRKVSMATTQDNAVLRLDDPKHGTTTGYRNGCRSLCCRRAVADAAARRRKRQYLARKNDLSVDSTGTRRRIQALVSLGWSMAHLSDQAGYVRSHTGLILRRYGMLRESTAGRYAEVYERLSMSLPPETNRQERIVAARSRNLARKNGWVPPLAWDDIDSDAAPAATAAERRLSDDIDRVKVERVLAGLVEDCTTAERLQVIERWDGSLNELERVTGWNVHRLINGRSAA